jgi:hypothetical protein
LALKKEAKKEAKKALFNLALKKEAKKGLDTKWQKVF